MLQQSARTRWAWTLALLVWSRQDALENILGFRAITYIVLYTQNNFLWNIIILDNCLSKIKQKNIESDTFFL